MVYKGHLTYHHANIIDEDVETYFSKKYQKKTVFMNDAQSMAVGYHALQGKYDNLVFYFHPRASRTCGTGIIVDGKFLEGTHSIVGEMRYLTNQFDYSIEKEELAWTPEGALSFSICCQI